MPKPILASHHSLQRQQGLTLMELMVALALSSFLMLAVTQTFLANQQSSRTQVTYARVQESGRIATEFLQRDIRMADYWGCSTGAGVEVTDHLDHSDPDYTPSKVDQFKRENGLTGQDDVPAGTTVGGKTVTVGTDVINMVSGTGAGSGIELESPWYTDTSASIHAVKGHTLTPGQTILMTNCSGVGDVVTISNTNINAGTIVHNTGTINVPGAVENADKNITNVYREDLQVIVPKSVSYFLSTGANGNPSLFRSTDGAAAVELVNNVENMQVLYGEDRNDDNFVERYSEADAAGIEFENVKTVRIQLLVAGAENVGFSGITTFNGATVPADGRLRRVYSTTVAVRNRVLP